MFYCPSPTLSQALNLPLHQLELRKGGGYGMAFGFAGYTMPALRRYLEHRSGIKYLIAHSIQGKGMELGTQYIGSEMLGQLLQPLGPIPLLILNTCYGIDNGLAKVGLVAGVETILAAEGPIPIQHMTTYSAVLMSTWKNQKLPIRLAVEQVNFEFQTRGIQFQCFGNDQVTLSSILR